MTLKPGVCCSLVLVSVPIRYVGCRRARDLRAFPTCVPDAAPLRRFWTPVCSMIDREREMRSPVATVLGTMLLAAYLRDFKNHLSTLTLVGSCARARPPWRPTSRSLSGARLRVRSGLNT